MTYLVLWLTLNFCGTRTINMAKIKCIYKYISLFYVFFAEVFAVFAVSSPFPNTKYAATDTATTVTIAHAKSVV